MMELLIAFTVGVAAGMAIEAGVRRVEWRSVLRRRAKADPRRRHSGRHSFQTGRTMLVRPSYFQDMDEMVGKLRQGAELRPEGTDD
jgi:hypothetical protein